MSSFGHISEGGGRKDFTLAQYLMFTLALVRLCVVSTQTIKCKLVSNGTGAVVKEIPDEGWGQKTSPT